MSLSIKSPKANRLARELADLTGESVTEAVTIAVEERLSRLRRDRQGLADRLMKIGREAAPHFDPGFTSQHIGEMLYDERGLPK